MDFKLQYRPPNIFWCLGVWTKKIFSVISHTYLRCLIQMAQYHNNIEKNQKSWSKIIISSCQNKIKNKSFKMGHPNVHLYIASILAVSFLRRLKNNNIFTLQLSNPDSYPPKSPSKSVEFMDYFYPIIPSGSAVVNFVVDLYNVSNVSITMYR